MEEIYLWDINHQTEISKFISAIQSYQDVFQFNVQVNQVMIMQMLHRLLKEEVPSICTLANTHIYTTSKEHSELPYLPEYKTRIFSLFHHLKMGGCPLIITHKVEHILPTYFPENWRPWKGWKGLSYTEVVLYPSKYSSRTDRTIVVATATETWTDPPCCQMYTANSTCYELSQDETITDRT